MKLDSCCVNGVCTCDHSDADLTEAEVVAMEGRGMKANDYQAAALRTAGATDSASNDRILYTALGLAGEAGEVANLTKKVVFHKHPYTPEKFLDELGDVAWYLAINAHTHGYTLEEVFEYNIQKLNERYPGGFTTDKSINRTK